MNYFGKTKTDRFGMTTGVMPYYTWSQLRKQVQDAKQTGYQYTISTTNCPDTIRSKIWLEAAE
jgi:hypothetical protein